MEEYVTWIIVVCASIVGAFVFIFLRNWLTRWYTDGWKCYRDFGDAVCCRKVILATPRDNEGVYIVELCGCLCCVGNSKVPDEQRAKWNEIKNRPATDSNAFGIVVN